MAVNTKTLSVRVPIDVAKMVENTCKQRGLSKNQLLSELIASQGTIKVNDFNKGGVAKPMDDFLTSILVSVGGFATGACVYHLLNNHLPKEWDEETRELVSVFSAIASGFAMAYGIDKATRK
jgi:hypothetical protein